jgi:hypothetical protein
MVERSSVSHERTFSVPAVLFTAGVTTATLRVLVWSLVTAAVRLEILLATCKA